MEDRVVNILIDIKADIGELKKGQIDIRDRMGRFENRMDGLENRMDGFESRMDGLDGRMDRLETDIIEVKTTVSAIAEAVIDTSRDVTKLKAGGKL